MKKHYIVNACTIDGTTIPEIVVGTKEIVASVVVNNATNENAIILLRSSPDDFKDGEHYTVKEFKSKDALLVIRFTNKGSIDRFIESLNEVKDTLKYNEIEDWEARND